MSYDFDTPVSRRGTHSLKWDVADNERPMWVADMDFRTAPEILEALRAQVDHGVFGYSVVPDAWYDAYRGWWQTRHGFTIAREWLIFCTGVIPALSSVVRKLTTPNEQVLLQTPVYNNFFTSIVNNGRQVLCNPLIYEDGRYRMNFADLEAKLSDPQTTMMFLCNPQNPTGQLWDRDTLALVGELCQRHHVTVVSDEIHGDVTDPGCAYTPFASVSKICRAVSITCLAPTKTFNLAGLQTAAVVIPDEVLRHKVWRALNTDEIAEPNVFAVTGAIAAFTKGAAWLDALRAYLFENKRTVEVYLRDRLPEIRLVESNATYLLWLDAHALPGDLAPLCDTIRREGGLYLSDGAAYGENGRGFLRLNIACPRSDLLDGLERLSRGVRAFKALTK